jgi:hypothetical protein
MPLLKKTFQSDGAPCQRMFTRLGGLCKGEPDQPFGASRLRADKVKAAGCDAAADQRGTNSRTKTVPWRNSPVRNRTLMCEPGAHVRTRAYRQIESLDVARGRKRSSTDSPNEDGSAACTSEGKRLAFHSQADVRSAAILCDHAVLSHVAPTFEKGASGVSDSFWNGPVSAFATRAREQSGRLVIADELLGLRIEMKSSLPARRDISQVPERG